MNHLETVGYLGKKVHILFMDGTESSGILKTCAIRPDKTNQLKSYYKIGSRLFRPLDVWKMEEVKE